MYDSCDNKRPTCRVTVTYYIQLPNAADLTVQDRLQTIEFDVHWDS